MVYLVVVGWRLSSADDVPSISTLPAASLVDGVVDGVVGLDIDDASAVALAVPP